MHRIGIILVIYNLTYTVKYNSLKKKKKKYDSLKNKNKKITSTRWAAGVRYSSSASAGPKVWSNEKCIFLFFFGWGVLRVQGIQLFVQSLINKPRNKWEINTTEHYLLHV